MQIPGNHSLPPRDSGRGIKWGLDICFPGEDWIHLWEAMRKVPGDQSRTVKNRVFIAVCLQFSYTASLGSSRQGNKGDGPEQNDDEATKDGQFLCKNRSWFI